MQAEYQQHKMELEQRDKAVQLAMREQEQRQEMRHKEVLAAVHLAIQTHTENQRVAQDKQKFIQETVHSELNHRQQMAHTESMAKVKQQQAAKGPKKP